MQDAEKHRRELRIPAKIAHHPQKRPHSQPNPRRDAILGLSRGAKSPAHTRKRRPQCVHSLVTCPGSAGEKNPQNLSLICSEVPKTISPAACFHFALHRALFHQTACLTGPYLSKSGVILLVVLTNSCILTVKCQDPRPHAPQMPA
jgi:hypothetical protein